MGGTIWGACWAPPAACTPTTSHPGALAFLCGHQLDSTSNPIHPFLQSCRQGGAGAEGQGRGVGQADEERACAPPPQRVAPPPAQRGQLSDGGGQLHLPVQPAWEVCFLENACAGRTDRGAAGVTRRTQRLQGSKRGRTRARSQLGCAPRAGQGRKVGHTGDKHLRVWRKRVVQTSGGRPVLGAVIWACDGISL